MKHYHKSGYTLIELLIVLIIIGILVSVVIPKISNVSSRARDAQRIHDTRTLSTALTLYYYDHGHYPFAPEYEKQKNPNHPCHNDWYGKDSNQGTYNSINTECREEFEANLIPSYVKGPIRDPRNGKKRSYDGSTLRYSYYYVRKKGYDAYQKGIYQKDNSYISKKCLLAPEQHAGLSAEIRFTPENPGQKGLPYDAACEGSDIPRMYARLVFDKPNITKNTTLLSGDPAKLTPPHERRTGITLNDGEDLRETSDKWRTLYSESKKKKDWKILLQAIDEEARRLCEEVSGKTYHPEASGSENKCTN